MNRCGRCLSPQLRPQPRFQRPRFQRPRIWAVRPISAATASCGKEVLKGARTCHFVSLERNSCSRSRSDHAATTVATSCCRRRGRIEEHGRSLHWTAAGLPAVARRRPLVSVGDPQVQFDAEQVAALVVDASAFMHASLATTDLRSAGTTRPVATKIACGLGTQGTQGIASCLNGFRERNLLFPAIPSEMKFGVQRNHRAKNVAPTCPTCPTCYEALSVDVISSGSSKSLVVTT